MKEELKQQLLKEIDNYDFQFWSYEIWIDVDIEHNVKQLLYLLHDVDNYKIPFKIQYHWNYRDWFYYIVEYYEPKINHHIEIYDSDFELECLFYSKDDIIRLIEKLFSIYEDVKNKFN